VGQLVEHLGRVLLDLAGSRDYLMEEISWMWNPVMVEVAENACYYSAEEQ
jgi:hypothetical protein